MNENGNEYEIYFPGQINGRAKLYPTMAEESKERSLPQMPWPEWTRPKVSAKIPGDRLTRFRTGESLRKFGKGRYIRGMGIMMSPQTPNGSIKMADYPSNYHFVDGVPSFGQVGFGMAMDFGQELDVNRTNWGGLINELVTGVEGAVLNVLKVEEAPYKAQVQQATTIPTTQKSYLFYILIGGGILFFMMSRKKK